MYYLSLGVSMLHKVRAEMNLKGEVRLVRPQDIEEAYRIEVEAPFEILLQKQRLTELRQVRFRSLHQSSKGHMEVLHAILPADKSGVTLEAGKDVLITVKDWYPEDEAATYERLIYRQREAGDLFLGYFEGTKLIGYICSTRYSGDRMQEESMTNHIPNGDAVCIHSVCVDAERRREGIALHMLQKYVDHIRRTQKGLEKCLLLCKAHLIPLYTRAGFVFVSKSDIVFGKQTWFEMELKLRP